MDLQEIAIQRYHNQYITNKKSSITDVLNGMGAIQAQDFPMSLWAVGCRTNNATNESLIDSFNKGEILRTHVMRPTWHVVSPENIRWMLKLTSPRVKALTKSRDIQLGLDDKTILHCNQLFEKHLQGGKHCTTDDLKLMFDSEGVKTDENRLYHILMRAEQDAIICSGALKNKKQTYCLLEERVSPIKPITYEESLFRLAKMFFSSHGPASIKDFAWWSGLSMIDVRKAIEMNSGILEHILLNGEQYYFVQNQNSGIKTHIAFLPAFDELIISYKCRDAVLLPKHQPLAYTSNGIFKPVVVVDGIGIGTWKRMVKKTNIEVEICLFEEFKNVEKASFESAIKNLGSYYQSDILHRFVQR